METYLQALDLWEAVEEDYEVPALPNNPTMAQIRAHKEKKTKKSKARACLFARILSLKSAKDIWDYLKIEYEGDERNKGMQVLNLIREFELQRIKDSETIKEYSDRITTLENTKDLSKISLAGLLNALQAQEQRRLMRADTTTEGALAAKHRNVAKTKRNEKQNSGKY
ncbi:hypothetical protein F511_41796 [Dorcoceras hygrometricum]|uniref:Uncharacterized protein n=1 Tax=Dorcoceras hygrometricum TaxID=472368 RepID=A0A2Z7CFD5_9LAMI|nr:hypothetical protein F511_41796 [Dorcoceras hygrometricum]